MIASSATVLANLAYLIGAVVFAVIIGGLVWLRHRQPKSVDANMALFRRGLSALAPDRDSLNPSRRQPEPIRTVPSVPVHVRVEPGPGPTAGEPTTADEPTAAADPTAAAEPTAADHAARDRTAADLTANDLTAREAPAEGGSAG